MSTIRFMRTFLAIARHGTFSEAAERVALTQAAVSFQMRALETELGRELFDRSGRSALLNASGRELLPEVRRLLDLYEQMRLPRGVPGELTGSVSLGAIVSCMAMLARIVAGLKASHPQLDVHLFSGKSNELARMVETGELDAAFLVEGGRPNASTRWTPLYTEQVVVLAPRSAKGETAAEILSGNPFLRFDRSQRTGRQIDRCLRRMAVNVKEFIELNSIETVVSLVRQDVGVALLPQLIGSDWHTSPTLRVVRLPDDLGDMVRGIGMIERRDHDRQNISQEICARYAEFFENWHPANVRDSSTETPLPA
jgi:DNA-binding transcriptional LysR family regulator